MEAGGGWSIAGSQETEMTEQESSAHTDNPQGTCFHGCFLDLEFHGRVYTCVRVPVPESLCVCIACVCAIVRGRTRSPRQDNMYKSVHEWTAAFRACGEGVRTRACAQVRECSGIACASTLN